MGAVQALERHDQGAYRVWTRPGVLLEPVLASIRAPGTVLKDSPKAVTWQSGEWVVKQTKATPRVVLKQVFAGSSRRQAFDAAVYLEEHGVSAPRAVAYAERSVAGLTVQSWVVTEFLGDCIDVEAYLDRMIENKAQNADITDYLSGIAAAVNQLVEAGAHHRDLAGKNILTRDGQTFYFIDLDALDVGRRYTADDRLKNHVQLYDSFCDRIDDTYLEPFIAKMHPATQNIAMYMGVVKKAQKQRRARTEAIWVKEGR